ncbi:MAG: PEP-CTERM sorting domain-containing protein [Alphaproteobacteria bacterium]
MSRASFWETRTAIPLQRIITSIPEPSSMLLLGLGLWRLRRFLLR